MMVDAGRFEPRVVIAGDVLDPAQSAPNQAVQKGSPMHLGFGQRHRHAQYSAVACLGDANGHQHRAVHHLIGVAYTLVAGIQNHIGRLIQGAGTPGLQALIKQRCAAANLRG